MKRLLLLAVLSACGPVQGRTTFSDNEKQNPNANPSSMNPAPGDCVSDARDFVYVVDREGMFASFDPQAKTFKNIGRLKCPAQTLATPFSMAVDRQAVAWVLYSSGEIFQVSTKDASCKKTSFQPNQGGLATFGMGFVLSSEGDDRLYIAGGGDPLFGGPTSLAELNTQSLRVQKIAQITGNPELTGTGEGKLWGFFPSESEAHVAQIDRTSGKESSVFPVDAVAGFPEAWAFAFWGGRFWIFLKRNTDSSSGVYQVDAQDGTLSTALENVGRDIVGAGVSTCAPIDIF